MEYFHPIVWYKVQLYKFKKLNRKSIVHKKEGERREQDRRNTGVTRVKVLYDLAIYRNYKTWLPKMSNSHNMAIWEHSCKAVNKICNKRIGYSAHLEVFYNHSNVSSILHTSNILGCQKIQHFELCIYLQKCNNRIKSQGIFLPRTIFYQVQIISIVYTWSIM